MTTICFIETIKSINYKSPSCSLPAKFFWAAVVLATPAVIPHKLILTQLVRISFWLYHPLHINIVFATIDCFVKYAKWFSGPLTSYCTGQVRVKCQVNAIHKFLDPFFLILSIILSSCETSKEASSSESNVAGDNMKCKLKNKVHV